MTVISLRSTGHPRATKVATYLRLFLLALVWLLAYNELLAGAGGAAAACLVLGLLAGLASRRGRRRTTSEARLDAAPDVVMLISAPVWLYWLDSKAVGDQLVPFVLFSLYPVSASALVLIRRRRELTGYSFLAKLGTSVVWVFIIYTFEVGVSWPVMIGTIILSHIYLAEDLLLLALNDDLDDTSKEVLFGRDTLARLYPRKTPGNDLPT